jgi:hypothetical protein
MGHWRFGHLSFWRFPGSGILLKRLGEAGATRKCDMGFGRSETSKSGRILQCSKRYPFVVDKFLPELAKPRQESS